MLIATASPAIAADGDPVKGEAVFKKCMACHKIGDGAKNAVGPVLNGVVGRKTGTAEGYAYSKLNLAVGSVGHVWTADTIFAYLEDPNVYLKKVLTDAGKADLAVGTTKMTFKLKDESQRRDVVAYLQKFSPPPAQ
ncbi:MAG: c-type cytochrome [Hyphomicrobiaceae bacterium]